VNFGVKVPSHVNSTPTQAAAKSHSRLKYAFFALALSLSPSIACAEQNTGPIATQLSQVDLFAGYSAWIPHNTVDGHPLSNSRQGIIASGAYYLKPLVGIELVGDYHLATGNVSMRSVAAGPIFRRPLPYHFTGFVHVLGGAAEVVVPSYGFYTQAGQFERFFGPAWGPQLTVGGGLDWTVPFFHHRLNVRLLQADYVYQYIHFAPTGSVDGSTTFNTLRLSSGIVFRFGAVSVPTPVSLICSVAPQNVLSGELLSVTGNPTNLNRHKQATFHWIGPGVGQGEVNSSVTVDTAGLSPGTYRIGGQVSEGPRAGESARCTTQFRVMPMQR
jgi:hypothetical protein